ncbi:MAG: hypothetical protein ACLFNM_03980 [Candidatus Woesearchaeota archaeon]
MVKNPPSILIAFGCIGWIFAITGFGWMLALGSGLQVAWLTLR